VGRRRDFGVIISEPSGTAFSIRWWEGGRCRRRRGFQTKTKAGEALARIRTAKADGVLDAHRKSEIALSGVAEEWLRTHSAVRLRSHEDNVERWARLEALFGEDAILKDVTPSRILEIRRELLASGLKPATVNRYLAEIRTILNYAVTAGYLQTSPITRFGRGRLLLPEPKLKRSPPLATNAEGGRLLRKLREGAPDFFAMFAFLLTTGARRGEAAGLSWADVDLARRVVTIRRSYETPPKSGAERTVPITPELAAILVEHRARGRWPGALVFPNPANGRILSRNVKLSVILSAACAAAGVARLRVHDLRHAHASLWLMAGGSLTDVQHNLGHSTPVLTSQTYGHIADDHRVREAERHLNFGMQDDDKARE
jgi:integrase